MKRFMKVFFISFFVFTFIYSGIIFYLINSDMELDVVAEENEEKDIVNKENEKKELKVLLLGVDSNDMENGDSPRTDTMMLYRYDNITGDISLLSIPRDTRAYIRGRKGPEKINHAHAYGGPDLSMKAVKDLLGVEVDYYVKVDYRVVEEFVDIIGGVEVDVPMNMKYDDPTADPPLHINLKKGKQILSGEKSLQFLRFRKGYVDQDLGRINSQQEFIKAAIKQTLEPSNITKLPEMVRTLYNNVDTNIPLTVATKYILKARSINLDNINMAVLPGEPKQVNGLWYFIPDENESDKIVNEMFENHKIATNSETE